MKVKIFNAYQYASMGKMSFKEVENKINDFIKNKVVLDIKVSGAQCENGWEMFQYVVIYEEEVEE